MNACLILHTLDLSFPLIWTFTWLEFLLNKHSHNLNTFSITTLPQFEHSLDLNTHLIYKLAQCEELLNVNITSIGTIVQSEHLLILNTCLIWTLTYFELMLNFNIPRLESLLHLMTSLISKSKLNLKMTQKYKHVVWVLIMIL